MKTKNDPRHQNRVELMRELFTWDFDKTQNKSRINHILESLEKLDKMIQSAAPQRPIEEINKIDLSILRLATFELIISKDAPVKVVVDEAVEMGKEFGSDTSASFINGVLGKIIEKEKLGESGKGKG